MGHIAPLCSLYSFFDLFEDLVDVTGTFDGDESSLLRVVIDEGDGVLTVHLEPVPDGILFVVVPLVEFCSALVADSILCGFLGDKVVYCVTVGA